MNTHDVADLDEDTAAALLRRKPESATRLVRLYRDEIRVRRGARASVRTALHPLRVVFKHRFPGDESFERRVVAPIADGRDGAADFPGFGAFAWEFPRRRGARTGGYLLRETREVSLVLKVPRHACF